MQGEVLLCDEVGDQAGAVTADAMAHAGCQVAMATPDRTLLHDLGPTTSSVALKRLVAGGVTFMPLHELVSVAPEGNRLRATLRDVLTHTPTDRIVDHVVSEHGAVPNDEVYRSLVSRARNGGQLDHRGLAMLSPRATCTQRCSMRFESATVCDGTATSTVATTGRGLAACLALIADACSGFRWGSGG